MKINPITNYSNTKLCISVQQYVSAKSPSTDSLSFKGLYDKQAPALFVFDLDGTFANGDAEDIKQTINLQKERNASLVYATGRDLGGFKRLQNSLKFKNIELPTPQYLIADDGQFIYKKNSDGELEQDLEWQNIIKQNTGFDEQKVYNTVLKIANRQEYLFKEDDVKRINNLEDVIREKNLDKNFLKSKIGYYEWSHSCNKLEFSVSSDVNIPKFLKDINSELNKEGIKPKFITNKADLSTVSEYDRNMILEKEPIRISPDGKINYIFVCAADKAEGVEYVRKKLDIPYNEIVLAGNDGNDISLNKLTDKGSFFICVANATNTLKDFIFKNHSKNTLFAKEDGAKGILEGIKTILAQNSNDSAV